MQIKRDEFLKALKLASLGTSSKEIAAQSSFFMFTKNRIVGDNETLHVSVDFETGIEGALIVEELLGVLVKMTSPVLNVDIYDDRVIFKSGRSRVGLNLYPLLRERIAYYEPLKDKNFQKVFDADTSINVALDACAPCCSSNLTARALSAVCVTEHNMMATDNFQAIRVNAEIPNLADKKILIPAEAIPVMRNLGYTEFYMNNDNRCVAVAPNAWVAFDAIDQHEFNYPDLSFIFDGEGTKFNFPDGFVDSIEKAALFAKNTVKSEEIMIDIKTTKYKMTVHGEGSHGFFEEDFEVENEKEVTFFVKPETMVFLMKQERCESNIVTDDDSPRLMLFNETSKYCVIISVA